MAAAAEAQQASPSANMDEKTLSDTMQATTLAEAQSSNKATTLPAIVQKPFLHPTSSSKPSPSPALASDQANKYNALLSKVLTWTTIPNTLARNSPSAPITDDERQWLTRECLLRYLRAAKWSVPDATSRLLATLSWRREYGISKFTPEYISPENETGKQVVCGYDIAARPCLMMSPGRQNTKSGERQIQHLVFMLERTIDLMGPGQESLTLLINFGETRSGDGPKLGQGKQTMYILQNHYPERLGRALVQNVPWFFWGFFKLISPFIDPLTREKLKFNEDLRQHIPREQLLNTFGGDVEFKYDHNIYWPALNQLADERRKEQEERWVKGGKRIGELEMYLKGGDAKCLADLEAEEKKKSEAEENKKLETEAAATATASGGEKLEARPSGHV